MSYIYHSIREFPYRYILEDLLDEGKQVDTGHWQAIKDVPNTRTVELQHVLIDIPIAPTAGSWAAFCRPNLPWAEDHFQERVAGEPTNPGEEYKNWPWYDANWAAQDAEKKFSHTYMERFWPKQASGGYKVNFGGNHGIRFKYGDLNDLVELLLNEPYTRQAYLPIWFPEDLMATRAQQRVPCTLGYHFMLREDKLHCFYPMRSVDLIRYLRDDAYMAGRLVQWIIDRLVDREVEANPAEHAEHGGFWSSGDAYPGVIKPGTLSMFCSSLHIFEDELVPLRKKHEQAATK